MPSTPLQNTLLFVPLMFCIIPLHVVLLYRQCLYKQYCTNEDFNIHPIIIKYQSTKFHVKQNTKTTTMIRSCRGKKTITGGSLYPSSSKNKNTLFTITESQYLETINDDSSNSSSYDFYPFSLIRMCRSTTEINMDALDIITGIEEVDGIKYTEEDEKTVGTTSITDDESDDDDGDDEDSYENTPPSAQRELHPT